MLSSHGEPQSARGKYRVQKQAQLFPRLNRNTRNRAELPGIIRYERSETVAEGTLVVVGACRTFVKLDMDLAAMQLRPAIW